MNSWCFNREGCLEEDTYKLEQTSSNFIICVITLDLEHVSVTCMTVTFNPFDTKPMAKIAVKMSIMRVVKFMSS